VTRAAILILGLGVALGLLMAKLPDAVGAPPGPPTLLPDRVVITMQGFQARCIVVIEDFGQRQSAAGCWREPGAPGGAWEVIAEQ
jgi:hypothetical protein